MSPPINTPDGSEVSEIVLPDGSTASEVIGPDGNVVFEAGPDIPDSVVSRTDDDDTTNTPNSIGLTIRPKSTFSSVGCRISSLTEDASRARLFDFDGSNYIASVDVSGLSAGDVFKFDAEMNEGLDYGIELDNNGSEYTIGYLNSDNPSFPYQSNDIDIVGRSINGSIDGVDPAGVNDIGNPDGVLD